MQSNNPLHNSMASSSSASALASSPQDNNDLEEASSQIIYQNNNPASLLPPDMYVAQQQQSSSKLLPATAQRQPQGQRTPSPSEIFSSTGASAGSLRDGEELPAEWLQSDYQAMEMEDPTLILRQMSSAQIDDMSASQRPTSLRDFFQAFTEEARELMQELIEYSKAKTLKKKLLTVLVSVSSMLVFYDLLFGKIIVTYLQHFILWMSHHHATAVLAFVALFVVATLIFIPPTLLVFGAGFAFSTAIGFGPGIAAAILSCSIGSCLGAVIAFWRSRYMMRDLIYLFSKRYPLVRAADRALKRKGFKIMLLLRLCPLLPFNGLNYICGVTGVSLEDFTMSLMGILPFQIFTVVVGATTGTLALAQQQGAAGVSRYSASQQVGFVFLVAFGIATSIIALIYSWRIVKKELRKELQLTPTELDTLLHPSKSAKQATKDEQAQGGIEASIEVGHLARPDEDVEGSMSWGDDAEEWFWVWA